MSEPDSTRHVVIAGGSGFNGTSIAEYLHARGWAVIVLSRHPSRRQLPWRCISWDARTKGEWCSAFEGAVALINLVGRSVDCVKTPDNQDEILRSRVEATRILGYAVRNASEPPPVWIQMSSAHVYGDPPEITCTEDSPTGCGFAPWVVKRWEEEFDACRLSFQRPVVLRTRFVLGRDRGAGQGALNRLLRLARWGLGGTVGCGSQGISWIHELDLCRLVERSLLDPGLRGTYIASSPNPIPLREFMSQLRSAIGARIGLPATAWMVRFGAHLILRTDPELALYGRYVVSRRLKEENFEFQFPRIDEALRDVIRNEVA